MRRFLSTSFIVLALIVSAAGAAPAAHAGLLPDGNACPQGSFWISDRDRCEYDEFSPAELITEDQAVGQAAAADKAYADKIAADKAAAGTASPFKPDKADSEYGWVMIKIMSLFAWLLGVAALTLNYSVYYTVVVMGDYVHKLSAVGVTWRILRDIGNIIIIFGFLAIGISIILNTERIGYGKKMLPMLLVAAVFLNFSLFFAEAIVDTGNLFATQFYTQINGGTLPTPATLSGSTIQNIQNEGISNKIMAQLGLQTIYGNAIDQTKAQTLFKDTSPFFVGFMGIILFLITAFVMFSLAFILIARFVILLFLIIIAPIGFAGLAVPKLKSSADKWWSTLFEQTITAPVLLLLLYIALAVITDTQFLTVSGSGGTRDWTGTLTGNLGGFASVILSFLVAMGLLLAVVIISKKMSAFGGAAVMNFANSVKSGATKFAMGSARFAGRSAAGVGRWGANRTAGRAANWASQKVRLNEKWGSTQAGRLVATTLDKGGKGFKEAKEKTLKKHEEYVKDVGKALEEKHGPAIADARLKREVAENAVKPKVEVAQAEHTTAIKEAQTLVDEVKRLEEIIKSKPEIDSDRIEAEKNLPAAKEKVAVANAKIKTAEDNFKTANAPLVVAMAEEEKATKDLADAKRKAAVAYGKNVRTGFADNLVAPVTWTLSGPGGSAAGNKIIQDTLKKMSDTEKAVDMLQKAFKKETEAANKSVGISGKLDSAREGRTAQIKKEADESNKS